MKTLKLIFLLMAVMAFAGNAAGAENIKIAVIDTQKILNTSTYGKSAKAEITKKVEELTADLKKRDAELAELQQKLEKEALVMGPEMREEKEREFRIKVGDFKALEKKYKQEMGELNLKLSSQIQADVITIVNEIGKKEGYQLILEKGSLLYSDGSLDISDQVIKIYDENNKKKAK